MYTASRVGSSSRDTPIVSRMVRRLLGPGLPRLSLTPDTGLFTGPPHQKAEMIIMYDLSIIKGIPK